MVFREVLKQALDGQEVLQDGWKIAGNVIRETDKRAFGVTSVRKVDKETWWWNEEV